MSKFLYKFCPLMIPMVVCMLIYFKFDKNDKITQKISSLIKAKPEYKSAYCFGLVLLSIVVIGIIQMILDFPDFIFYILCGIVTGTGGAVESKLAPKRSK